MSTSVATRLITVQQEIDITSSFTSLFDSPNKTGLYKCTFFQSGIIIFGITFQVYHNNGSRSAYILSCTSTSACKFTSTPHSLTALDNLNTITFDFISNQMNVKSSTDITGVTVNALIEPRESYNQNIIAIDSIVENTLGNFVNFNNKLIANTGAEIHGTTKIGEDSSSFPISIGPTGSKTLTVGNTGSTIGILGSNTDIYGNVRIGNDSSSNFIKIGPTGNKTLTLGNTGGTINILGNNIEILGNIGIGRDGNTFSINIGTSGPNIINIGNTGGSITALLGNQQFSSGFVIKPSSITAPNTGLGIFTDGSSISYKDAQDVSNTIVNVFDTNGRISTPKIWVGSTTTNSSSEWSVTITSAGFSTVSSAIAIGVRNTSTSINNVIATLRTVSTSTITGRLVMGDSLGLNGGNTIQGAGTGFTVYVTVYGS